MNKFNIGNYKEFNKVLQQLNVLIEKQSKHITQLIHIGESLSAKNDLINIFSLILNEAMDYANADGGSIYVISHDKQYLDFKLMYNKSLDQRMGEADSPVSWPSVPLYTKDGSPNMSYMVSYVYHTKESRAFEDVYKQTIFNNTGTQKYDQRNNYRSISMAAIPLINHEDEVIGVIQLINASDEQGKIVPFSEEHITMLNSLASQAAISLSNSRLIEDLENLLLQFIKSIASAIDRKSKYTSGHVKRVATLTEDIGKYINEVEQGYFKDTYFSSDQLKELSMAAWMHDVGKIVTPDCIIDKATKLEKIVDRIDIIRMRVDLLEQVIEKDIQKMRYEGKLSKEKESNLHNIITMIKNDYLLIEEMNHGTEQISKKQQKEIERIQSFSYASDGTEYKIITDDEVRNLKIFKGTLTDDEFTIMKDHAQITWEMLSSLQFPRKYENIPFFASTHHERLNGRGYPNKLPEKKIPLQSRIIAVADVFEALIAERPYKKGKQLSEALRIIAYMANNKELDKDVLDLLIDSGFYLSFAKEVAKPSNIDEVDIEKVKKIYHRYDKRDT